MQRLKTLIVIILVSLLSGCIGVSSLWTGVSLIYDRHNLYKKMNDYDLVARANHALYRDTRFKQRGTSIDVAAFHGDLLLAGHVLTAELREEAYRRVAQKPNYHRLFNQITVGVYRDNPAKDSWITAKVRSQIIADASIDPHQFKVITADGVVYLMGHALLEDAERVIHIARRTAGVVRVVKLIKCYRFI